VKHDFASLGLSASLLEVVRDLGYEQPTPIQIAGVPALLAGRDLIGQSKTGSGKTAAFALPILQSIQVEQRDPQALIACPTRELSSQVAREFRKLARDLSGLTVLEAVGGQPARPQREALGRGVHVVVGTPGRIVDHLERKALSVEHVRTVVLDEADRMLDMGFEEEVHRMLRLLGPQRQTALFSATFPEGVEALSARVLRDAQHVIVDGPEESGPTIRQQMIACEPEERLQALAWVLNQNEHESALIFCNFKASVAGLTRELQSAGLSVDRLDGDLDQIQRDQVLARFRNQSLRLLVATDVAGRGIDVEGLDLVVNFELPQHVQAYVHRIGRTGRAGRPGLAVSLVTQRQLERLAEFEGATGHALEVLDSEAVKGVYADALLAKQATPAPMDTLMISGGRKDKVRPGDVLGALTGEAGGLSRAEVGKIEVQDRRTYVAVAHPKSRSALDQLNRGRIKGKRFRVQLVRSVSA
jgi:ATP-independent RNA helicase DbpA